MLYDSNSSTVLRALVAALLTALFTIPALRAQSPDAATKPDDKSYEAPARYANMPVEAVPYGKFAKPYKEWFVAPDTLDYFGFARSRDYHDLAESKTVNIGFLGPIENNPGIPYGLAMLHGAQLALEQANARGGYHPSDGSASKPFDLKIHNDSAQWGASSTEAIKMVFDEHVVGVLGAVDGASTHIMLRVALKLEFPIIDTATTDPTVTETRIPWLIHNFPDDRQQSYAVANVVFKELKLKRVGIIRTQSRYARIGVEKFSDEAKRMGHVPVLEVKFERGDQDFSTQLRMLKNAHLDAIILWAEVPEAAKILIQMRAMGLTHPVFGSSRLCYSQLLEATGSAAEGLTLTSALDPTRSDPAWLQFEKDYRARFNEDPDAYAARGYDGINLLVDAIQKAGLNRGKVMDALREHHGHDYLGVSGAAQFDYTLNNIAPVTIAHVENGKFVYSTPKPRTISAASGAAEAH